MNLLLLLIAAGTMPAIVRVAGMMVRLLVELVGGLVILAVIIAVLLALATHGKVI